VLIRFRGFLNSGGSMQTRQLSLVLSLLLTLCLFHDTQAQQAGRIESMKLLTPNIGWAATNQKLFWTTDDGAHWKDITPKTKPGRTITSAFFLDPSHGWMVLAFKGEENQQTGINETLFELASTTDAGDNWSVKQLELLDPDPRRGLSGQTWLDFVDAMHGWVLVRMNGSTAMSGGVLRATEDGGATWKTLGVPSAGRIRFVTPADGWLDGGANAEKGPGLYVTRDGGKNWAPISIKAPSEFGAKVHPTYQLPEFAGKDSASMLVTFAEPNDESPKLALFITSDGGRTWGPSGSAEEGSTSWRMAYAGGGGWLAVGCPGRELAVLRSGGGKVSESGTTKTASELVCSAAGGGIDQVSFVDGMGWALLFGGELAATSDNGQSWSRITPPGTASVKAHHRRAADVSSQSYGSTVASAQFPSDSSTSSVSTHLGFDKFPVIPKTSDMQTWMNSSPFYDVGIYLPGSKNKSSDVNLTPAWISAVQGQQGWGIMPIWFGVQSACSCYVNSTGQCVAFTYQINANATQAKAQGISEAKAAISSAQTLGLSPTVIYKDIENYTPDGSTCSLPVQAFLNGWDQQMQTVGKAGVYGNPLPAIQDFAKASPIPDDVWIAKYPGTGNPPQLTIWGLGKLTDSPNWTNSQRIHQVQQNVAQNWSPTSYKVDPDIENATVVDANAITKTYTYGAAVNIDCTNLGALQTFPLAINDMNNGAFINGPGQTGTIVGAYADSSDNIHGFQSTAGTCTSIDLGPASSTSVTELTGINNLGQIVGFYQSSTANYGYLLNPGKTPVKIAYYQGSFWCPTGINDAGQIVGIYPGPSLNTPQGVLYYGSTFYQVGPTGVAGGGPIDGATNCNLDAPGYGMAVNGDATVAGSYYPAANQAPSTFQESLVPPSWTGAISSPDPGGNFLTLVEGIDSNNELAGVYPLNEISPACSNGINECGFMWSGGSSLNILQTLDPAVGGAWAAGINDFGQVVGQYLDSAGYNSGALWTHQ
jgi:photosystem II stability/assembly factor-like uncharacterized protein